jgi:linoleoyl-CoA desaturase
MRKVKFRSTDKGQALFATTVRKNVDNYFKEKAISPKGNWEIKLKSAAMLSMYLLPFALILIFPMSAWLVLPLAVMMGMGKAGIGMGVMHDAAHGSYSSRKWVNDLMSANMYLLGSDVFIWKVQHNVLHHTYTNIEGLDGDIGPRGPLRLSEHAPLLKIHRHQHKYAFLFYGLMTLSKMVRDFSQLRDYTKSGITASQRRNPIVATFQLYFFKTAYLFSMIGLPLLLTDFNVWQVLGGFFIMHWVAGFILATIFQLAHVIEGAEQPLETKTGFIENDWFVHELQTTANFARDNRLLGWYIGWLNFQIEHHLFPHVSHIHYPKIAPIVEKTAHEFGYAYNVKPTFFDAIVSHLQRLKELGTLRPVGVQ